ncbi:MAG: CapA family protein, partial [Acidimicrobiia bacterium]|nr:CapA family protein [Acidimicrobiia bacterium]
MIAGPGRAGTIKLGLAGDTMLGRKVGARLEAGAPEDLFSPEVVAIAHEADFFLLNLECAISDGGELWPDPDKPFFFRAPPAAIDVLALLGVDCVTLANNHALDYGTEALEDTLRYLDDAGIAHVGAGVDQVSARAAATFDLRGRSIGIVGLTDHPAAYDARVDRAGVAYADLRNSRYAWALEAIADLATDIVLVTPHWGPNMVSEPVPHVVTAANQL